MNRMHWLLLVLIPALVLGCTKSDDKKTEPGKGGTTASPIAGAKPDQTVEYVAKALAESRPVAAWQALPASYQTDVQNLIREFAGKMDKEVWDKGFIIAGKIVKVLKEKKQFILEHPEVAKTLPGADKKKLSDNLDAVVGLLETIVMSEISKHDELKKADVERFLSGTGAKLMSQIEGLSQIVDPAAFGPEGPIYLATVTTQFKGLPAKLRSVKATVVKMEGTQATVRIEVRDEKPVDVPFIQVDGKWVPKELADDWPKMLAEAKGVLGMIPAEELAKAKPEILKTMNMVEEKVDLLLKAKTQEEFNKVVDEIMKAAAPQGAASPPKSTPVEGKISLEGRPLAGATVIFHPEKGEARASGLSGDSGTFILTTLRSGDGARPGIYKVTVTHRTHQIHSNYQDPGKTPIKIEIPKGGLRTEVEIRLVQDGRG